MTVGLAESRAERTRFYEHASRPEWGVAVLTWEAEGKGWQAWRLWGGDAGARWAARIVRREDPAWFNRFLEGPRNRALLRHLGISTRKV